MISHKNGSLRVSLLVALVAISVVLFVSVFEAASWARPEHVSDVSFHWQTSSALAKDGIISLNQDSSGIETSDAHTFVTLVEQHSKRPSQPGKLTFADRVAYQYAIEEVYWRHRIWPGANQGPKPSLDQVVSLAQVQQKVQDYLGDSQLLAEQWRRPITSEQLQEEMERIARHTKKPAVLRELFAVLGNDPSLIAECLARGVLAERLLLAQSKRNETLKREVSSITPTRTGDYTLPEIGSASGSCDDKIGRAHV